jgi:general secretion pathway protein I
MLIAILNFGSPAVETLAGRPLIHGARGRYDGSAVNCGKRMPPEHGMAATDRNTTELKAKSGGFTLIEVLVALAIVAVSLSVIFAAFSAGLRGRRTAEDYEQATMLAQSKLNTVGVVAPLQQGKTSGEFNDRYRWTVTVKPYEERGQTSPKPAQDRALVVVVTVSWNDANHERSVSLQTLRLVH